MDQGGWYDRSRVFAKDDEFECSCRANGLRVTGGRVPGRQAGPGRAGCGPRPKVAPRSCSCPSEPRARATGVSRASDRVYALVGPPLLSRCGTRASVPSDLIPACVAGG